MSSQLEFEDLEEYQNRTKKLIELREKGIEPYPHAFTPTESAESLHHLPKDSIGHSEDAAVGKTPFVTVAGRLVLFRAMGKNAFAQIQDHTGRIQIMFNRELTEVVGYNPHEEGPEAEGGATPLKLIEKKIDLGDIIGIKGHLFYTNKGELTVYAKSVTLLCKTLIPLPDKHSGLADKELRYRKRWLDLICHHDVQKTFLQRSNILHLIRKFMETHEFIEVETPILQTIYGGAEAKPFKTKLNALDQEMFLRISLEIPLKKLLVGGMPRVFEMGKVFRNEGIDRSHNPEFTLLEAYAAYWDYNDMMRFVENLFEYLALSLHGKTIIPYGSLEEGNFVELDLKAPWPRLTMKQAIEKFGNIRVDELSEIEMQNLLIEKGADPAEVKKLNRGLLTAALFEEFAEMHLIQPHHIIDHPIETTPLCKPHRIPEERNRGIVERFESFILGGEICNSYTELNDPIIQKELLLEQVRRREAGDEEASPFDEEFLEAICQGMPPAGGLGIGIDRLVMYLTNSHSIRDVLYFPWMKPKKETPEA